MLGDPAELAVERVRLRARMRRLAGIHSLPLLVVAVLAPMLVWQSSIATPRAAAQAPPPSIAITSPLAGSIVEGTVSITATATAGAGDNVTDIQFYDGANSLGDESCEKQPTCTASISWRATGLSGEHALTARVFTEGLQSATSAAVMVTVVSPPPRVSITSPTGGTTVKGTVLVSASATTDPSQEDYPTSISFYDGVNHIGSIECQGQQTCQGSVNWMATGLSGAHALTARVFTKDDLSVTSAPAMVTVISPPPSVRIAAPRRGAALRGRITIRVFGATDPSQQDYPTSIEVFDGVSLIGTVDCQAQQTCAGSVVWDTAGLKGRHSLTAIIHTSNDLTARSAAVIVGDAAHRRAIRRGARSRATATCRLASLRIAPGQTDRGMCFIHGAPAGTGVAVQYRAGSGFATVLTGHVSRKGVFSFHLRGSISATYTLSLLIRASSRSAAARAPIGALRVG